MDGLNTVLEYLTSVPAWYLATSVDGQPHVRPFSFAQIQDGKLWFVTARTKDVWQELLQNQRFEATSWWPGHGWLILRGRAGLDDRALGEMREAGWKHLERLGEHYEGPNDPTLVFFSVEDPEAFILQSRRMGAGRALASWLILTTWFSHGRAPYCPAPLGAPVNTGPAPFVNSFKRMCRECFNA